MRAPPNRTNRVTKKQLKALIRTAKTPEDQLRIAAWYRNEAASLRAQAMEQDAMADEYDRNPMSHPIPKGITYGENCRNLARYYRERAKIDARLAAQHEEMASGKGRSPEP